MFTLSFPLLLVEMEKMILMVVISYPEEIPATTCIEGYGSFEISDYTDCCCYEGKRWDDEGVA